MWSEQRDIFKVFFKKTEVQLTYNVVLISAVQQSDSDIYIYIHTHTFFFRFFSIMVYHSSVQFSCSVVSDSLRSHEPQHARPPCPSPIPGVYSNSCPLSRWCHPTISSSVIPFSSCPQSFPASGSFPMSQLFALGGQSIGASALVLLVIIQGWFLVCGNFLRQP